MMASHMIILMEYILISCSLEMLTYVTITIGFFSMLIDFLSFVDDVLLSVNMHYLLTKELITNV
jgi:hypothetical protein